MNESELGTLQKQIEDIKIKMNDPNLCVGTLKTYQRISGYFRCITNFNNGKQQEFKDRINFKI